MPVLLLIDGRLAARLSACLLMLLAGTLTLFAVAAAQAAEPGPALPILVYHQIRDKGDTPSDGPTVISLARFESQMRLLHENGYVTIDTDEVFDFIKGNGTLPGRKIVAIHFDDGWKSGLLALPVLGRYGFRASFWVIPGTGIGEPHMDWAELQALRSDPRYEVQSHTMTHPWKDGETLLDWINGRAPGKGVEQARWKLVASRRLLSEKLDAPINYLAWPRGLYDDTLIKLATESGYRGLFTVDSGVNLRGGDVLRIRRTIIHGSCDDQVFKQVLVDGEYRDCSSRRN